MAVFVISAARRDEHDEVSDVLMAGTWIESGDLHHGDFAPVPVFDVVNRLMRGDRVHLFFGDDLGSAVKVKVLPNGMETIQDAVQPHPGRGLADLPTF